MPSIDRLSMQIEELAQITEAEPPIVTRVIFSESDLRARAYVRKIAEELGLEWKSDPIGNQFALWRGSDPGLAPAATGSHIDAIPNAGRYDGVVGVLGALEAVRMLQAEGFKPRRGIEVIVFTSEEPTRFGIGCLGSRLLSGSLSAEEAAKLRDQDGASLDSFRAAAGFEGSLESVRQDAGRWNSFIELHIEQGPLLEAEKADIGIVESIAGPSAYRARFTGAGGHAGAVLMPGRSDALLAGAEVALALEKAASESGSPDTVATTGVFRIQPGAINSIPCGAWLELDLRDTDLEAREKVARYIAAQAEEICARRGVCLTWEKINADPPAACDPAMVSIAVEIAEEQGLQVRRMVSRAYHDTLFMAQICPATMIFIPSYKGYSHRPDEFSSPEQIACGVRVLASLLRSLAA